MHHVGEPAGSVGQAIKLSKGETCTFKQWNVNTVLVTCVHMRHPNCEQQFSGNALHVHVHVHLYMNKSCSSMPTGLYMYTTLM